MAVNCTTNYTTLQPTSRDSLSDRIGKLLLVQIAAMTLANPGSVGSGSPEGVVTANPGTSYLDGDTDSLWYKKTGTGNTGWVQLIG